MTNKKGFSTRSVHSFKKDVEGATSYPVYQSAAFSASSSMEAQRRFEENIGYVYSRYKNPTVQEVEERLASLEEAEDALLVSSGMFAIVVSLVSLLRCGDHLLSEETIYGGTQTLFKDIFPRWGIDVTFVDTLNREQLIEEIRPETKVLYLETPGNPLLKILPLEDLANLARAKGLKVVVDSTFATPYFQNPLNFGCDLVVHSATKFLGGHGDLTAGVVAGSKELLEPIRTLYYRQIGGVLAPWDAFLLGRGLATLSLRMERSSSSALYLASKLENHPKIKKVFYPGLSSHPQYEIACHQMKGFGGVLAFELKGEKAALKFQDSLKIIQQVASLGDVHTLITHPASTSHRSLSKEERIKRGISDGLLRLSVGLEGPEDLWEDLLQALLKI